MSHKHKCPLCKKIEECSVNAKHDEHVVCQDGFEAFCDLCQKNRWDEMIKLLKKEDRI